MHRSLLGAVLAVAALPAFAQFHLNDKPNWVEGDVPPPPAQVRTQGLVALDMGRGTSLQWGVDPASVQVGDDGVVRYVVVATSASGTVNAIYEGIHCSKGEVKVYARHNPDTGWTPSKADWQSLHERQHTRHSLVIARTGACIGQAPAGNATQVVRALRAPVDHRFLGSVN